MILTIISTLYMPLRSYPLTLFRFSVLCVLVAYCFFAKLYSLRINSLGFFKQEVILRCASCVFIEGRVSFKLQFHLIFLWSWRFGTLIFGCSPVFAPVFPG